MTHYCDSAPGHEFHGPYHDTEYGFPTEDETVLMERLALEIFQAGLSWLIVLKKRSALVRAFNGFDVDRVAAMTEADVERLLADETIIRNRLKVLAIIHNAGVVRDMRTTHGGFAEWIRTHHPKPKSDWVKLFKKTFKFTGGEITGEFLMSVGYLPGAHRPDCPVFQLTRDAGAPWFDAGEAFYTGA